MDKKQLRSYYLQKRNVLTKDSGKVSLILANVLSFLENHPCRSLGFYWPISSEVDLTTAVGKFLKTSSVVASLPCTDTDPMHFIAWSPNSPMMRGRFNIPVPAEGKTVMPELLLIPCLACDSHLYRLGYGGGWYDRYLASRKSRVLKAGICFADCLADSINPEPHDIPLDLVITEKGY